MPRKKAAAAKKTAKTPTLREKAQARFEAEYLKPYEALYGTHPWMKPALLELARIEIALEECDRQLEEVERSGQNPFLAAATSKAPHLAPVVKMQQQLRSAANRLLKALNISAEKKTSFHAEHADEMSSLLDRMKG